MGRVLLVEDDPDVGAVLVRYLEHDGHNVVWVTTGREALTRLAQGTDVAVLDLTLPDLDGLEVLRRVRGEGSNVPVLVLTARGEESDRLLGLGLGADDYVVKPVSPREICLRVAALLRRRLPAAPAGTPPPTRLVWAGVELDAEAHRAWVHGQEVNLTPREFALLHALLREPERVVPRAALLSRLWPEGYVTEHVLDVHVASLRRKIAAGATIRTVRGIGYRLAAPDEP